MTALSRRQGSCTPCLLSSPLLSLPAPHACTNHLPTPSSGSQSLWGFQLANGQRTRVGLAAGVGPDMPPACREWLEGIGADTSGLILHPRPTPRAWQVFEADGRRTQVGKVEKGKERKGNNTTLCPPARARVFRLQAGMHVCGREVLGPRWREGRLEAVGKGWKDGRKWKGMKGLGVIVLPRSTPSFPHSPHASLAPDLPHARRPLRLALRHAPPQVRGAPGPLQKGPKLPCEGQGLKACKLS